MTPLDIVLARLPSARKTDSGYASLCPAHDDQNASLSITPGEDGKVLVHCFAGCPPEAVVAALGLTMADLFPERPPNGQAARPRPSPPRVSAIPPRTTANVQTPPGLTVADYASAKHLDPEQLRSWGVTDGRWQGSPAVRLSYRGANGAETAVRYRIALDGDRFRWRSRDKPALYGLWRLPADAPSVVLVEGESDAHTLWANDIPALGIPGAASWRESWAEHLAGIATIYIIIESDRGGAAVLEWLSRSSIRERTRLLTLAEKDSSALYLADPARFVTRWEQALAASIPWPEFDRSRQAEKASAAWRDCAALARSPDILAEFASDLEAAGVVGERRLVKLLLLVIISRLLARLISLAVKGPSSGGKSWVVERVLDYVPRSAYYPLSAMSEHALAYSQEPLAHRFIVLYEAVGLGSDFASYLMRSLLSEGRVRYETVEKTPQGLRARLIEREGPTGLIVTTTAANLHAENETRVLSVTVDDTQGQTKAVLAAIARGLAPPDPRRWHALQEWLDSVEHRVVIPYAEVLAAAIPPVAVRLRRDFGAVLRLIEAHAILHQAGRERNGEGAIIATTSDYEAVRTLVADLVSDAAERTVSTAIRETVDVIADLADDEGVTVSKVAAKLRLDRSTTWRRVRVAIDRGYVKNLETRERRPARLVIGDSLPDNQAILPDVCTFAFDLEGVSHAHAPSDPEANEDRGGRCRRCGHEFIDVGRNVKGCPNPACPAFSGVRA